MAQLQQLLEVAGAIGANLTHFWSNINLTPYIAPLAAKVNSFASPHIAAAWTQLTPVAAPYLPYLGEGKLWLGKVPQEEVVLLVVGVFGGILALQLILAFTAFFRKDACALRAFSPTVFWLLLCLFVHTWIEYNFVYNRDNGKSGFENGMNLYGAADYRYGYAKNKSLTLEAGTGAMEFITTLEGPLCLLLAWAIVGNKAWRWALQLFLSTCQMYGLAWFCAHTFYSTQQETTNDPFLYWVFFVGFNAPWGIVPPLLAIQAVRKINKAVGVLQREEKQQKERAKVHAIVKKNQ